MSIAAHFRKFSKSKLETLAGRIDDCLERLDQEQIWWREAGEQNAVGNLVLHLCGNLGQWIGTGVDGRPDTRKRDEEFQARGGVAKAELRSRLKDRVRDAAEVIAGVSDDRLLERVRVQAYDISVLEAIYHVVEHFAQHTGQVIYATKLLKKEDLGYYSPLNRATHTETEP